MAANSRLLEKATKLHMKLVKFSSGIDVFRRSPVPGPAPGHRWTPQTAEGMDAFVLARLPATKPAYLFPREPDVP